MYFEKEQVILVDTNVIIEAHRLGCWNSLADFFNLETVEKCIEETQTGFQQREPEEQIDSENLQKTLSSIHSVSDIEIANFYIKHESKNIALDDGELHLLIHAERCKDAWMVNSPDKAAMRFIFEMGWHDQMVSLESMINRVSSKTSSAPYRNFTENWLLQERGKLVFGAL